MKSCRVGLVLSVLLTLPGLSVAVSSQAATAGKAAVTGTEAVKPGRCLSEAEVELGRLVNKLRADRDLPAVPIKEPLYRVAKWHVIDLQVNAPHRASDGDQGAPCNLHSWSDKGKESGGGWKPLCYTPDHKQAQGMWRKPREISDHRSNGYENIYWTSAPLSPSMPINYWEGRPEESDMILQRGAWSKHTWRSMGVGIIGNYAAVWFSDRPIGEDEMSRCEEPAK